MLNYKFSCLVAQTSFVLFDDAKLRRLCSHSKLFLSFFLKSNGQGAWLWTKHEEGPRFVSKGGSSSSDFVHQIFILRSPGSADRRQGDYNFCDDRA